MASGGGIGARRSLVHPTRILENRPANGTGPEVEDVRQGLRASCLIGYETGLVPDWFSSSVLGLRSDGSCLDR